MSSLSILSRSFVAESILPQQRSQGHSGLFTLSITYPRADVQTALRAVSTVRSKRPIVLMGDRDRGKSHIMVVIHHAVESSTQVQKWTNE